jgi:hypothetical protein
VALVYLYGGNAKYFDYIYIAALSFSCLFCWKDKDTLGALFILLGYWCWSKPLFMAPDILFYQLVVYGCCVGLAVYYFHHVTAKIFLILVLFAIGAEIYWESITYAHKPRMIYWFGLLALTIWAKQLLFNRIFIAHKYFNYTSGKTGLDTHLGSILYLSFGLIFLMAMEYLVRHIGGLTEVTTVHYLFTPVSTFISGITLAIIYMHYFNNQSKKYLPA